MGNVDADPARKGRLFDPGVDPRMAGRVPGRFGVDIARHIARRDAARMAAGQEQMGVVLAHPGSLDQGAMGAGGDRGRTGLIRHRTNYVLGETHQVMAAGAGRQLPGQAADLVGRLGQPGRHRKQQRRQRVARGQPAAVDGAGRHHALGHDGDGVVQLVQGQHMRQVAVGVDIGVTVAGCVDVPGQHALLGLGAWCDVQLLDAVGLWRRVAVQGLVADAQFHLRPPAERGSRG